jgi:4-hydroxybenzoate polyprenyltransferase
MANRWWVYQRERFPVIAHGLLIAAFSSSAVCFSALLRSRQVGEIIIPQPLSLLVAYATAFLFFLQLRIADEFKDFEEDSRYRPYRPVPRGLIKLRELAVVFFLAALIQVGLALWLDTGLLLLLAVTWTYLVLMSKEFFVAEWLKRRHILYMVSHMIIVPLVDFYATACDWRPAREKPPPGLLWFVVVSYFNGLVIEIGRKIRGPQDEEIGVNTYSHIWGARNAVIVWLAAMTMTALFASVAAYQIDFLVPAAAILVVLLTGAFLTCATFLRDPSLKRSKRIEGYAGIWTLSMYLTLGAIPWLLFWSRG